MPDLARPVILCDARKPICPRCQRPLRRIWVQDGTTCAFCDSKRLDGQPGVCGQHSVIFSEDGTCSVSALSKPQFDALQEHEAHMIEMRQAVRRKLREVS